jgi:hypothetical protein
VWLAWWVVALNLACYLCPTVMRHAPTTMRRCAAFSTRPATHAQQHTPSDTRRRHTTHAQVHKQAKLLSVLGEARFEAQMEEIERLMEVSVKQRRWYQR